MFPKQSGWGVITSMSGDKWSQLWVFTDMDPEIRELGCQQTPAEGQAWSSPGTTEEGHRITNWKSGSDTVFFLYNLPLSKIEDNYVHVCTLSKTAAFTK